MSSLFVSIRARLFGVLLLALAGIVAVALIGLFSERATLMADRQVKTRHLVESAASVLNHFYEQQQKGTLSEEQAKAGALGVLRAMRYEKSDYFWVNDMTPTVVMHPIKPELDGKDASQIKDQSGKALFVEFVDVVKKNGSGFVNYMWSKPGMSEPVPKISYVQGFAPWGWVVGSGIYVDDVEAICRERALRLAGISLLCAIVVGIMFRHVIRGITLQMVELKDTMRYIQSSNDLTRRVPDRGGNELSQIGEAFNGMVGNFQQMIRQVSSSSQQVLQLTSRVSSSSAQVAQASMLQNEASSAMAAAMEETKSSIQQVADSSGDTFTVAEQSGQLSRDGEQIVADAAGEMTRISAAVQDSASHIQILGQKSDEISNIVNVIREIADQTNLLALNAAIEAARAGEQGRGFAVVADEVRKLAERTAKSTQEITEMIGSIREGTEAAVNSMEQGSARVREGVTLANQAGGSMADIRGGAERVLASVSDISAALREQSAAVALVTQNVERIVAMAEQNSAETGQIASHSGQLEALARDLETSVRRFVV
ncbi:MAG TPA: methyl-accepting chemotaxis protein [Rhodocyclaceae bacterium]